MAVQRGDFASTRYVFGKKRNYIPDYRRVCRYLAWST